MNELFNREDSQLFKEMSNDIQEVMNFDLNWIFSIENENANVKKGDYVIFYDIISKSVFVEQYCVYDTPCNGCKILHNYWRKVWTCDICNSNQFEFQAKITEKQFELIKKFPKMFVENITKKLNIKSPEDII